MIPTRLRTTRPPGRRPPCNPSWALLLALCLSGLVFAPAAAAYGPFSFTATGGFTCFELHVHFSAPVSNPVVTQWPSHPPACPGPPAIRAAGDSVVVTWPQGCVRNGDVVAFTVDCATGPPTVVLSEWYCYGSFQYSWMNDTPGVADRFEVCLTSSIHQWNVVQNPPGCPMPMGEFDAGANQLTLTWPSACVDPGEQVIVQFNNGTAIGWSTYRWSATSTPLCGGLTAQAAEPLAPAVDHQGAPGRAGLRSASPDVRLFDAANALLNVRREAVQPSRALPETAWVGHVVSSTGLPGTPGGDGPYRVGRGPSRPGVSPNGIWDWDGFGAGDGDSLQGWWPIRLAYESWRGPVLPDFSRPWEALDYGNQANYRLNSQHQSRTFGVIGVWHGDAGAIAGHGVGWYPIEGVRSAWCGLRRHGDLTHVDPVTGNPFNQSVLQHNGVNSPRPNGTSKNFPGYGSQWDQMLYRDVYLHNGQGLDLSFCYQTRLSTGRDVEPATRTGWFDKDPLAVTSGNFISSTNAGSYAPVDSFMVYVGLPVSESNCRYSDGVVRPVDDPLRRWFSEVLRVNDPGVPYYEMLSVSGDHGTPGNPAGRTTGLSLCRVQALLDLDPDPDGGVVRLVFRVKTNRGFDDEDGGVSEYSSDSSGAVILDDVRLNGTTLGDFESPAAIDNQLGVSPLQAWKSTGKPPAVFFHTHDVSSLSWQDPCGPPGSPDRQCSMLGTVISSGDHDRGEAAGGQGGTAEQEREDGIASPTVNLCSNGPGDYNGMGIDQEIAQADEYYVRYDIYGGIFDLMFTGNSWTFGFQSYPATQKNGTQCWGELRLPGFRYYMPFTGCFTSQEPAWANGLIRSTGPGGVPDSLRVFLGKVQDCFRFGVSLGCSPTSGAYFDNVSLAFVHVPEPEPDPSPGPISVSPWDLINDTFPFNEDDALPGTASFDTCAALLKTGRNIAPLTGTLQRVDIPGDSMLVWAGGSGMRVDLVFRILPGPGNCVIPGIIQSGLRRVPTSLEVATAGDGSFWGEYLADNGEFGSPEGHGGSPIAWSQHAWNSARCDTAERNLFPVAARGNLPDLAGGSWAATYHENDPKFATLGIDKPRCFLIDTSGSIGESNITCGEGVYPPEWTALPSSGYSGQAGTREYTKIIPDGLLTPGSHVQYFFRKSWLSDPDPTRFTAVPDTNLIYPQPGESSRDGHRFQQFGVLPDRWKDMSYGGMGQACMLYVDLCDGGGDERHWVSVADSIGATHRSKWGAHNGWHAGFDWNYEGRYVWDGDPIAVRRHGGQPGTSWDMFGVKGNGNPDGGAGSLGSRLALAPIGRAAGKGSRQGPTLKMLRQYYPVLLLLSGDLESGILGPHVNRSQDDVQMLKDFLSLATPQGPRGLLVQGEGFVQAEDRLGLEFGAHSSLLSDFLGVALRDPSYRSLSGNTRSWAGLLADTLINPDEDHFSVRNGCRNRNNVLAPAGLPEAVVVSRYEDIGGAGPYAASVLKPPTDPVYSPSRSWLSLVDGWGIGNLLGAGGGTSRGRLVYYYDLFITAFGYICTITGAPTITLDTPHIDRGKPFVDFMAIRSGHPARGGPVRLAFGITVAGRVEVNIYDLAGRKVRVLADRVFPARVEHLLTWDGTDDEGRMMRGGVYYWQVRSAGFTSARKLVVLR